MSEKPIYIDLGDGSFSLWNARRKRLRVPGGHDLFRGAPHAYPDSRFADDEHLLRHNDECEAEMISLDEPDEAKWESLRRFIAVET